MKPREAYKRRVQSFQRSILTVQLLVMLIGGSVFTLAVIARPILRITRPEHCATVKWIVNVMVGASLIQIVAAAYDILSGCWKLIWPLYLGIAGTSLTVLLELTGISSSIYLYSSSLSMVDEGLISPWYWVECLKFSSCHARMESYIHFYILPQVLLAIVTVILQCITILLLSRLVRTIAERDRVLQEIQGKYRDQYEEKKFREAWKGSPEESKGIQIQTSAADSTNADMLATPKRVMFFDGGEGGSSSARKRASASGGSKGSKTEHIEMVHTSTYEAQIHPVV